MHNCFGGLVMLKCFGCGSEKVVGFILYEKTETRDGDEISPASIIAVCKTCYGEYMELWLKWKTI